MWVLEKTLHIEFLLAAPHIMDIMRSLFVAFVWNPVVGLKGNSNSHRASFDCSCPYLWSIVRLFLVVWHEVQKLV